jgi:hypothetical protein
MLHENVAAVFSAEHIFMHIVDGRRWMCKMKALL